MRCRYGTIGPKKKLQTDRRQRNYLEINLFDFKILKRNDGFTLQTLSVFKSTPYHKNQIFFVNISMYYTLLKLLRSVVVEVLLVMMFVSQVCLKNFV